MLIGLPYLIGIQILVPTNRDNLIVYSTIVGLVVDIIVNVFAIPALDASDAAIAGKIAECSITIVQFKFLKLFILPIFKKIHFIKISLSLVLVTLLTISMLTVIQLNVFWTLAVSASLFFVVFGISLSFKEKSLY